jgi:hypothetical protein
MKRNFSNFKKGLSFGFLFLLLVQMTSSILISNGQNLLNSENPENPSNINNNIIYINPPKFQAGTNPSVVDNASHTWTYATDLAIETSHSIKITATWNETAINATLVGEQYTSSWNAYQNGIYDLTSNGTTTSRFTITTASDDTVSSKKRLKITAYLTNSSQWITTSWQGYEVFESAEPTIDASEDIVYALDRTTTPPSLNLTWTSGFSDNVGIWKYVIARKTIDDGFKINSTNFDKYIKFTTYVPTLLDTTIEDGNTTKFYYGIRAYDYKGQVSGVKILDAAIRVDVVAPSIASYQYLYDGKPDEIGKTYENKGTYEIRITTQDDCLSTKLTIATEGKPAYTYTLAKLSGSNVVWRQTILLTSIEDGTYNMSFQLTDDLGNTETYFTKLMFIVLPPGVVAEEPLNLPLIIGLSVGGGAVLLIGLALVLKKKKADDAAANASDVEFSEGGAGGKKRKGKIYSGASSIGRASGKDAELLQKRRGVTEKEPVKEKKSRKQSQTPSKSSSSTSSKPPVRKQKKKEKINIDELLSDKKPVAMKVKKAEGNVDLGRKMDFLESKLMSLDQNLSLVNVILEQTETLGIPNRPCPSCTRQIPQIWMACPYCELDNRKPQLSQKMKSIRSIGSSMICPVCKKLLESEWNKCPYCFVRDNNL